MINYYEVLNCPANSTLEEIRKSYKQLLLKFHPDKNKSNGEFFLKVQEAWNVLSDERKRQQFDLETELRNSRPLLYGSFNVAHLARDSEGNCYCSCRCGGTYILDEEDHRSFSAQMEDCGCENKCLSQLSQTAREYIYENYQRLIMSNEKYLYLAGLIYKEDRKEKKKPGHRKNFSFHVRVDGLNICVCQKTFENVHGISSTDVEKVLTKVKKNVVCLEENDELFVRRATLNRYAVSTRSKDRVIEHMESILSKSEVKEHILKGEKLNLSMLYADYKTTLEKERRLVAVKFDGQSGNDEHNRGAIDYNPVSMGSYKIIFEEAYPGIIEKLKKDDEIDSSQISPLSHSLLPFQKRNVHEKRKTNRAGKRHNLTDQSSELSTKRMKLAMNDSTSTQECQSGNLYVITDDSNESALYLLPTSTKIFNKTNLMSDVVETVYYL